MSGDTEREALARYYDPKAFEDHPIEKRSPLAAIQWGARRKLAQEAADRVLDSGWLAEHDKRVKAEADAKVRKHVESMSGDPEHPIEAWHRESLLAILDRDEDREGGSTMTEPDADHYPNIGDTCCGKCPGATCYVDYLTGERDG